MQKLVTAKCNINKQQTFELNIEIGRRFMFLYIYRTYCGRILAHSVQQCVQLVIGPCSPAVAPATSVMPHHNVQKNITK